MLVTYSEPPYALATDEHLDVKEDLATDVPDNLVLTEILVNLRAVALPLHCQENNSFAPTNLRRSSISPLTRSS
jgi:hypothetical protein